MGNKIGINKTPAVADAKTIQVPGFVSAQSIGMNPMQGHAGEGMGESVAETLNIHGTKQKGESSYNTTGRDSSANPNMGVSGRGLESNFRP